MKSSNKNISGKTYKTILIIEAIRTLGQYGMNDEIRSQILKRCTKEDIKMLNQDGIRSQRWIYEEIKKIIKFGGYDYAELG